MHGGAFSRFRRFSRRGAVSAAAPVTPLLYDFSSKAGVTASGITIARSGATVYPQLSASTCESVGNNLPIWEDQGGVEGGGLWIFETFTNSHASPFDFTTSWTRDAGASYTANVAVGPDGGATTVDRIRDDSAVADARLYRAGASAQYISLWVRDTSGDAPTEVGMLAENLSGGLSVSMGTGTTWRRLKLRSLTGAATHFAIFASTTAGTGAVELWGSQRNSGTTTRAHHMPLANGGSAAGTCTGDFPAADLSRIIGVDGNIDIELKFLPSSNTAGYVLNSSTAKYAFRFDTPNGEFSLRYVLGGHWTLMVNGVDRLTTIQTGSVASDANWREGDEVALRVYVTPTTCRVRNRVNCSVADDARVTVAAMTLAAPTAGWLGSSSTTASTMLNARLVEFRNHTDHATMLNTTGEAATIVMLGDSTMAVYNSEIAVSVALGTVTEGRAGKRIANICQAGNGITGQTSRWNSSQYANNTSVLGVVVQVGINDVAGTDSVATMTTNFQALITALRVGNASLKIVVNLMLPADTYSIIDATDEQNWIDLNSCISGVAAGGGAAITGIDTVISAPSITANANGSVGAAGVNILRPEYEISTPDGVHENVILREIIAAADRAALISLGVW